jgi:hypothetical protein
MREVSTYFSFIYASHLFNPSAKIYKAVVLPEKG